MEGPLLVLKSWMLTALAIWAYRRYFQRVAPPSPTFEAFCAKQPAAGAIFGRAGIEQSAGAALASRLGKPGVCVATLGGWPWPHYKLQLRVEQSSGVVLLRIVGASVLRTRDRDLPALATLLREALGELPESAQAWLCTGAFNNGLVEPPAGGWMLGRGNERRPRLEALGEIPPAIADASHQQGVDSGSRDSTRSAHGFLGQRGAGRRLHRSAGVWQHRSL